MWCLGCFNSREGKEAGRTSRAGCVHQTVQRKAAHQHLLPRQLLAWLNRTTAGHPPSPPPPSLSCWSHKIELRVCKFPSSATGSEPSSHMDALDIISHSSSPAHPTPMPTPPRVAPTVQAGSPRIHRPAERGRNPISQGGQHL